ncbi:hypothetical protein [Sagittula salina]|uniref:Uncharacterized protein n=1 Tax=Sagittula salina TaxID=2820268 RepID=A0A940MND9_9RHOB|nr:hypothetical protein [Sagittula salina]MBP0481957.1 hypothetical protein [Sagittula salina]
MTDLKKAILDAKYIDMIALGDFVVRDCGLPDVDADGNLMPQANEIAAAVFRWAADMRAMGEMPTAQPSSVAQQQADEAAQASQPLNEYDEHGDPVMDAAEAERLEAAREAVKEESA